MIQRRIEEAGIPTVSITLSRELTEAVRPPRALYLNWPLGHSLGRPFYREQQMTILMELLIALYTVKEPGEILSPTYDYKQEGYEELLKKAKQRLIGLNSSP
ncbi:MAG: hypothetical protein D6710_02320 [Nitrospirae bacterium]|nr:MAG: hypothetical protein D6710_02320 [Nitrospirota bacterium]